MSTRSIIARENSDGSVDAIYCHSDGYIEHHAPILLEHYTDPAKVDALIALGSISSLGQEIGEKHDFNDYSTDWVRAYHRDRGEDLEPAIHYANSGEVFNPKEMSDNYGATYGYLFRSGAWVLFERDYNTHSVRESPLAITWEAERRQ